MEVVIGHRDILPVDEGEDAVDSGYRLADFPSCKFLLHFHLHLLISMLSGDIIICF